VRPRFVVRPYLRFVRSGPDAVRGIRRRLRQFAPGEPYAKPQKWHSAYGDGLRDILLPHWRWGNVVWGFELSRIPSERP
jgi:hypothetical protein